MKNAIKVLIFTVVILLIGAVSVAFLLGFSISDFDYVDGSKSGTIEIIAYNGDSENIVIPEKIMGKEVSSIAGSTFSKTDIKSVEIPETVTVIGEKAFAYCENLESVKIGENVEKILEGAFFQCTSLKSANIPASLKNMDGAVFYDCKNLELTVEDGGNFVYKDGVLFNKDLSCVYWVKPDKNLANYTFPDTVTELTPYLLGGHEEIKTYTLPKNLVKIPNCLLLACSNLETVIIPEGVKTIGDMTLMGCMKLKSVTVPASVGQIGTGNFPVKNADEMNDFVLKVYNNSSAFFYAQENDINFEVIK